MPALLNFRPICRKWSSGVSRRQRRSSSRVPLGSTSGAQSSHSATPHAVIAAITPSTRSPPAGRGRSRKLYVWTPRRTPLTTFGRALAGSGLSRTSPASASVPNSLRVITLRVHRKCVERVAGGDEHVLPAADHVRLGSVRHLADLRVPQRIAV